MVGLFKPLTTSAFVCDRLFPEYMEQDLEHHTNYLGGWLTGLKKDDKAFFRAVSHAQKAADYLIDLNDKPLAKPRLWRIAQTASELVAA